MFKVGVIGATGYIGNPYRKEIRESSQGVSITHLCARRRGLLEAAGIEDQCTALTDNWRLVVDDPEVDLVLVLTPDALHHEAAMACAAAGKHLFCEKPVGVNVSEAWQICDAYRQAEGLAHFVPFWTRYSPLVATARELVQSDTLGDVRAVVYRWHNPRPATMPFTWRDDASLSSAGSVADVGSHAYDTIRWMLGKEVVRVGAHADVVSPAKPDLGEINLEEAIEQGARNDSTSPERTRLGTAYDYASIAFEFCDGAVGTLILSHAHFLRKGFAPEIELHGTKASLAVDRVKNVLLLSDTDGSIQQLEPTPEHDFENRFQQHVFPALQAMIDGHPAEHPNLEDGFRVQLFTDAAAESARLGEWVTIDEIDPSIS